MRAVPSFVLTAALVALAACSPGHGSALPAPQRATKTIAVQLTIVIPLPSTSSAARRIKFVSAGTMSGGIAINNSLALAISQSFDLSAGAAVCTQSGSARTCQVTVDLPLGNDSVTLFTYDGALASGRPSGHQLGVATVTQTIVEGQANTVVLSLLGVPASVTIVPQKTTLTAGTSANVPLTVTVFDASGNAITGTDPYSQPIAFSIQAANGQSGETQDFNFSVNGGNTTNSLARPGDTIALTYNGNGGTGSAYTVRATIDFGNTIVGQSGAISIAPGFSLIHQLPGNLSNADLVQRFDNRDIWFTEPAAHKIGTLATNGTLLEYALPSGKEPRHIVHIGFTLIGGGTDFMFSENADTIGVITSSGTITETPLPTTNAGVGGMFFDSTAFRGWFAESAGKIGMADLSGHVTEFPTDITGSAPAWVSPDSASGRIWFTDPGTNSIGSMSKTDHTVLEYPIPTASAAPSVIAEANTNDTWFAENNVAQLGHINNFTHAIVEYPAPDVIVSLVPAAPDGSGAALWALTRGGVILRYDASGNYTAFPVTLVGNGTPIVIRQQEPQGLLILRQGISPSDLDAMAY